MLIKREEISAPHSEVDVPARGHLEGRRAGSSLELNRGRELWLGLRADVQRHGDASVALADNEVEEPVSIEISSRYRADPPEG